MDISKISMGIYIAVGFMVVSNMTVILAILTLTFKAGLFVSATNNGIKDAKDTAVRAHKRIDKFEEVSSGEA